VHLEGVEEMKPIAWMSPDGKFSTTEGKLFHIPLYTAPREWQYLTDDEIKGIVGSYGNGLGAYVRDLFNKIEAKIREKNE
jgi:hypothetical protein